MKEEINPESHFLIQNFTSRRLLPMRPLFRPIIAKLSSEAQKNISVEFYTHGSPPDAIFSREVRIDELQRSVKFSCLNGTASFTQ